MRNESAMRRHAPMIGIGLLLPALRRSDIAWRRGWPMGPGFCAKAQIRWLADAHERRQAD